MNASITVLAVAAAYLIGAIPFGYCFALWLKGIDIRTVGSGNIGATNVGRTFGFRYFWLIFLFDLGKGLLPTWGFPILAVRLTGRPAPADMAVLVALAAILGHNYPIYLKFKGGKGVATSLGALLALDPGASLASAASFTVFLVVTRYVSLSSMMAGLVFVLVHFLNIPEPFSIKDRAMTVMSAVLLIMLVIRHRANIARIWAGTEHKIELRKKRTKPGPDGKVAVVVLAVLAGVVGISAFGLFLYRKSEHREVLKIGSRELSEATRVATGHQRAEKVVFADSGKLLVVTCPRYQRLVIYKVEGSSAVVPFRDLELRGKPVAIVAARDRIYVLERPPGDSRHVESGWLEAFDFEGASVGNRITVGFYPDDMAITPDLTKLAVLTSGRAEGSEDRPRPALSILDIQEGRETGRLEFEGKREDPRRITLSETGKVAVVTLVGSDLTAAVDLTDPNHPRLIQKTKSARGTLPYLSKSGDDAIVMPTLSENDGLRIPFEGEGEVLVCAFPEGSALEFLSVPSHRFLGRLPLRAGLLNLGTVKPTGLAYSPERRLIAVASRSGGVHLISSERLAVPIAANEGQGKLKR